MIDWSWPSLFEVLPDLLRGTIATILFTLAAFPVALVIGFGLALAEAKAGWLGRLAIWFVEFVRSTPLLVQIYALYFFLPKIGIRLPAYLVGVATLGLHYACYISRVYLAGLRSVPSGQWEAAFALGLPRWATLRLVIARQALVPIYPALANYLVTMFKETPLLSAIGIVELMQAAKIAGSETFRYTESFTAAAVIFLAITLVVVAILRVLERRVSLHLRD